MDIASPKSVVALLIKDGLVLSVTRRGRPGDLSLVGGSIDDEKDRRSSDDFDYQIAYRALCRETLEETGVIVNKAQWVCERIDETDGNVAWCYRVFEWDGEPRTMEPGIEVSWRRPEELLTEQCTFRDYNSRLFRFLELVR